MSSQARAVGTTGGALVGRRRRAAAIVGLLLFILLATTTLLLIGLRSSPQPAVAVLRSKGVIRAGATIEASDLDVTSIYAADPAVLATLARAEHRDRLIGQVAVSDVPAGALIPADVAAPQASASLWDAAIAVKRMPSGLRAGDHVALLVEVSQAGRSIDVVLRQDVAVLHVGATSVDLWLPAASVPQVEWFADHGGVVLVKMQSGAVQSDLPAGGGP